MPNIISNSYLDSLRGKTDGVAADSSNDGMLTQSDFFALLGQQLSQQDPFQPTDNSQMISQMASYSTVNGINDLTAQMKHLTSITSSNQALQASSLVGQQVLVPSGSGYVDGNSMRSVISAPSEIQSIKISIEDEKGNVIRTDTLDGSAGGNIDYTWDGKDNNGDPVDVGVYTINANGNVNGTNQDLPVSTYAHVSSVSLGTTDTGAILNLKGLGSILLGDVLAVSES